MMPQISSVIERRLLVNYRVEPDVAAALLPAPLRPHLVGDWAVAGICLIRLGRVRPVGLPSVVGVRSENAAHRIAVEWDGPDGVESGVYIPRRDSGSPLNVLLGGRLFPGVHSFARFDVEESGHDLHVAYTSRDSSTKVSVDVRTVDEFEGSAMFPDLAAASDFFQRGRTGFSASRDDTRLDGLELDTHAWQVSPARTHAVRSTFFEDQTRFPRGSATLDCTLLMRDVPAVWNVTAPMRIPTMA
ncbi:DUF2071 domain-containing protein [Nocardia bhagyanarayanae]|uniref:Uncharacterized protein YqjF (DUF2071 family) n=1 Tax=Nocardia bhagyanarayanae TaxID=1215925 RepID=A0A543EX30_9NOCA|nr:DUF2071 domain-containing protein [Nocardia bhagyanarayanae]TQM26059.1 uncharacterized protein YqjF (DUF2071 family) [Nocardia bhagyanarayanae]